MPCKPSAWDDLRASGHARLLNPDDLSSEALRRQSLSWLSTQEVVRWKAFATERLRHGYLASVALCRATLSHYACVDPARWLFTTNAHGKPRIDEPKEFASLRFSLTYTDGLSICFVSRVGEVGVDAERINTSRDIARIARHFLSPVERQRLARVAPSKRLKLLFEQWVLKEAYLKGTGTGITGAPHRLTIRFDDDGNPIAPGNWRLFLHRPDKNHVAAAAVRSTGQADLNVRWMSAIYLL
jgi:4'-phosphopantetheinyl transferase